MMTYTVGVLATSLVHITRLPTHHLLVLTEAHVTFGDAA
jgi:hypothetical protein